MASLFFVAVHLSKNQAQQFFGPDSGCFSGFAVFVFVFGELVQECDQVVDGFDLVAIISDLPVAFFLICGQTSFFGKMAVFQSGTGCAVGFADAFGFCLQDAVFCDDICDKCMLQVVIIVHVINFCSDFDILHSHFSFFVFVCGG